MTESELKALIVGNGNIPRHIAIIMDGNGRWAQMRGRPRVFGHQHGMNTVRAVVEGCRELGCDALTLFAFSEENWKRPRSEVKVLMRLLRKYIEKEREELRKNGIRLKCLGRLSKIDPEPRRAIEEAEAYTADCSDMVLNLAISYGSRSEIVDAARHLCREAAAGRLDPENVDESTVEAALYTAGIPDPDLLIRTSGEMRISNFLLWQIAYTEIFITPILWPDFTKKDLFEAIGEFQKRDRRFGSVKSKK